MKASGVNVPEFTTRSAEACTWLEEGHKVVERALLTGSQGRGITLWEPDDSLMFTWCQDDPSPLFTKYEKKLHEYRVHVADGRVIDVQMKRRRTGVEDRDNQIRNFHNGWVYCREDIVPPADDVLDNALRAVRCLGLQFGAADIGWNQHYQRATVYEVNTAPGLEGTTLDKYLELLGNMVAA
jgi:glutathione synthase/RimK-type ligase-like ATP-grasp enzyme